MTRPAVSAIVRSIGLRNGTRTSRPHRPQTTEGTAASRSTVIATGPEIRRGRISVTSRAIPRAIGTAMSRAIALVRRVPKMKGSAP